MSSPKAVITVVGVVVLVMCVSVLGAIAFVYLAYVQKARDVVSCQDNLRALSVAALNFESAFMELPPSTLGVEGAVNLSQWDVKEGEYSWLRQQNASWITFSGPYLDIDSVDSLAPEFAFSKRSLWDLAQQEGTDPVDFFQIDGVETASSKSVPQLLCPADNLATSRPDQIIFVTQPLISENHGVPCENDIGIKYMPTDMATSAGMTNYLAVGGAGGGDSTYRSSFFDAVPYQGALRCRRSVSIDRIADGAANTLLIGETVGQIENGRRNSAMGWLFGGHGRGRGDVPFGESTLDGDPKRSMLGTGYWSSGVGFGSKHTSGVGFVCADGSTLVVNRNVDPQVLYAWIGSNDGEVSNELPRGN